MKSPRSSRTISPGDHLLRRRLVQVGGLGFLGAIAGRTLEVQAQQARPRACILVFYYGGPSHIDTYDMKPDAPAEIRGEFQSIDTVVPGIRICEHLPHCAKVMDKLALVRGMHHGMRNHNSAAVEALCGRTPLRGDLELLADDELSFPCYGSALGYLWRNRGIPLPAVALPHVMYNVVRLPGQDSGLLGAAFNPLQIEGDPNAVDFRVPSLDLREEMSLERLGARESLLGRLQGDAIGLEELKPVRPIDTYYQKTFSLLRSEPIRKAVDLSREAPQTRDFYGRNGHGQSVLLARRLVEAGVPFVTVFDGVRNGQDANWDSHQKVFERSRDHLLPPADKAFAALISDLDARGLLDTTMVIGLGEFGRTPKINSGAGRDHWPDCYTVVMAGGGIRGGQIRGSSDRIGAYPDSNPATPGDLAATIYAYFGLDPHTEIHDATGRPFRLAEGEPMNDLF